MDPLVLRFLYLCRFFFTFSLPFPLFPLFSLLFLYFPLLPLDYFTFSLPVFVSILLVFAILHTPFCVSFTYFFPFHPLSTLFLSTFPFVSAVYLSLPFLTFP